MNWIKCSDRLPDINEDVLIYDAFCNYIYSSRIFDINYESRKRSRAKDPLKNYPIRLVWLDAFGGTSDVTHWMPLPESPRLPLPEKPKEADELD